MTRLPQLIYPAHPISFQNLHSSSFLRSKYVNMCQYRISQLVKPYILNQKFKGLKLHSHLFNLKNTPTFYSFPFKHAWYDVIWQTRENKYVQECRDNYASHKFFCCIKKSDTIFDISTQPLYSQERNASWQFTAYDSCIVFEAPMGV